MSKLRSLQCVRDGRIEAALGKARHLGRYPNPPLIEKPGRYFVPLPDTTDNVFLWYLMGRRIGGGEIILRK